MLASVGQHLMHAHVKRSVRRESAFGFYTAEDGVRTTVDERIEIDCFREYETVARALMQVRELHWRVVWDTFHANIDDEVRTSLRYCCGPALLRAVLGMKRDRHARRPGCTDYEREQ